MSWLLRDGDVLAAIEDRRRGWRRQLQGVVLIPQPALMHSFGCPEGLDAAWCAATEANGGGPCFEVKKIVPLAPNRFALPHLMPGTWVVASGGAFDRWRLQVGNRLEVRQA
jgi:hypothetical protein